MTSLLDVVRLEIDTAAPRNLLRNPSGQRGLYGWNKDRPTFPVTPDRIFNLEGSTSPVAEDGYAFRFAPGTPIIPPFQQLRSQPFPVQAQTWLHFRCDAIYTGEANTNSFTRAVVFYDAQGVAVASSINGLFDTPIGSGPTVLTMRALVPAAAVSAALVFWWPGGNGGDVIIAKISVRSGMASGAAVGPYVPANWVNIMGTAGSIDTEQGNKLDGVEDDLEPGSLVATVQDVTLDPSTATALRRGRPIRVRALVGGTYQPVWTGTLETADVDYTDGKGEESVGTITITGTDDARDLNEAPAPFGNGTGFDTQVASAARFANLPSFDGDQSPAVGSNIVARDDSSKASDWIRRACNTHGGYAWIDTENRLRHELVTYLGSAPILTASDRKADVGALYYTGIAMNYGTRSMVNDLTVKMLNTSEEDGAKDYGPYVASGSVADNGRSAGTIEVTAGSASALAQVVLPTFANPRVFPTSLKFSALDDLAKVLSLTPYAAIRVKRTAPAFNDVVRVLRIRHEIRAKVGGDTWLTTVTPRPLETATPTVVTTPAAGADTGPSDVVTNTAPGILGERIRSSNFNINHIQPTTIPFDTAIVADGITWDASNSRWVAPRDGRYHVTGTVHFNTNATGYRNAMIYVNGTERNRAQLPAVSANGGAGVHVSKTVKLVAGDVVSIVATQSCGVALAVIGNANQNTTASIAFIGP